MALASEGNFLIIIHTIHICTSNPLGIGLVPTLDTVTLLRRQRQCGAYTSSSSMYSNAKLERRSESSLLTRDSSTISSINWGNSFAGGICIGLVDCLGSKDAIEVVSISALTVASCRISFGEIQCDRVPVDLRVGHHSMHFPCNIGETSLPLQESERYTGEPGGYHYYYVYEMNYVEKNRL